MKVNRKGSKKNNKAKNSKLSEKKRSQLIDSINRQYESVYMLDDFKSYNNTLSSVGKDYSLSKTMNVEHNMSKSSRNQVLKYTGSQSSNMKIAKQSFKNDQLQEFLRESNNEDDNLKGLYDSA